MLKKIIEKKLGGYKQLFNEIQYSGQTKITQPKSVAVVGAGLAGMTAAVYLADRGFNVTVIEANDYLGGKLGSWPVEFEDGFKANVEHGYHGFFKQYYNSLAWLSKINADKFLEPVSDYLIMFPDQEPLSLGDYDPTPLINLLKMRKKKLYTFKEAIFSMSNKNLLAMLQYERDKIYQKFDDIPFNQFVTDSKVNKRMEAFFYAITRTFFATKKVMSTAVMLKSFHFYLMSNNCGLIYSHPNDDYSKTVWQPATDYLTQRNAKILLNNPVNKLEYVDDKYSIDGSLFDYVVLAVDTKGLRSIAANSQFIQDQYPTLANKIQNQKSGERYAVLRIWIDKDVRSNIPIFIGIDAVKILDAIVIHHRTEQESRLWTEKNGGGVYELHTYSIPDDFPEESIKQQLLAEFEFYFPEVKGYTIKYEYLQIHNNFTAFHTGLYKYALETTCEMPNVFFAGDWVNLPIPAMLMEGAISSGLFACNAILEKEQVETVPIYTVPTKGLFAL
ncbi:MAG: NAD(P)/FAD-dependent oxidoreductase [Gammaproteobacteria bacterium]